MIRFLHNFFFRDWLLKVFSLALAVLTWLAVSFSLRQKVVEVPGVPAISERTYYDLPVVILSASGVPSGYKAKPSELNVTVQGNEAVLENLPGKNIRVLVDMSHSTLTNVRTRPVEVITPAGVTHVRIEPTNLVEIIPPPPPKPAEKTE